MGKGAHQVNQVLSVRKASNSHIHIVTSPELGIGAALRRGFLHNMLQHAQALTIYVHLPCVKI